jgi:hypothetical protein
MNTKMKVLALALLGLAGYAGSAVAGCPSSPVPPWSVNSPFQGVTTIAAPGLDGTPCRLDSAISAGASGFASAQVEDDTPTAEPNYRAQFMINIDALAAPTLITVANVFSATSAGTGTGINFSIFGDGSGAWRLSYVMVDSTNPSGFFSGSVPLAAGSQHVEFALMAIGATSTFSLWNNNNVEASPDITQTVNNTSVAGIDSAFLGLAAPSDGFVSTYAGTAAQFDRFDSRRTTFIGF